MGPHSLQSDVGGVLDVVSLYDSEAFLVLH